MSLAALFSAGARRYDLLVALNPGYHAHLRMAARRLGERISGRLRDPARLLDLGCGTGASTQALIDQTPATVLGVDLSDGMVAIAREKRWPPGRAEFRTGSAGDATVTADVAPFDGCLAAYLLRNVPADGRDAVLRVIADQLTPGGVVVLQDYTVAGSARAWLVWDAVCWLVVIPLSLLLLGDARLYRYLWRSVRQMEPVERWCERLQRAGFTDIEVHHGSGWQRGILHTVAARRP